MLILVYIIIFCGKELSLLCRVNLTTNFNPHASSTNVEIGRGAINSATEFLTKIMEEYKEEIQKLGIPLQKIIGNLKSKL